MRRALRELPRALHPADDQVRGLPGPAPSLFLAARPDPNVVPTPGDAPFPCTSPSQRPPSVWELRGGGHR